MPKCDYCDMSRDKDNGMMVKVSGHWSFPDKLVWMCNECLKKKGVIE